MTTKLFGNWNYPTQIRFGAGRIQELAEACRDHSMQVPLLVTDSGLSHCNFFNDISEQFDNPRIFSGVKANPTGTNIMAGVEYYHQHQCDGVIAIGGGSALDAGKAIALMAGQKRPLWDFEDIGNNWQRINTDGIAPIIAVPTTAGTGSEVGRAAVIVDEKEQSKKIIFHPELLPLLVIADPELTLGLAPHITAATGLDAFVHNLEAWCAPGFHPMADGIALHGMKLIADNLLCAYNTPSNLQARSYLLAASTMGATAFQKGLGGVHALAHPLGAIFNKHHGLLNAILLPYVIKRNRPEIEKKIQTLSVYLNFNSTGFDDFFQWILSFRQQLNIPNSLADIGINTELADDIALRAHRDASAATNPINLSTADYRQLFIAAVNGEL